MAEGTSQSLVKGGLWLAVAGMVINLLGILSTIIVAWFLTPADYGLVAIGLTIQSIVMAITHMPLGEALIREKEPGDQEIGVAWTLGMLRGIVMAGLLLIAAYPVSHFYGDPRLLPIMLVLCLGPIFQGLENPKRFIQQRSLVFRQEFLITVTQKLGSFVFTVGIALIFKSYWALILGNIAYNLSGTIASYVMIYYRPRFEFKGMGNILHFSVWMSLGQFVNIINQRLEYLLIERFLGLSMLGIYDVGFRLAQFPTAEVMKPLKKVVYPGLTRVLNSETSQPDDLRKAYRRSQRVTTLLALPVGVGLGVLAEPLVKLILSERWHGVIFILQYLVAVFGFQTLGALMQPLAWAKGYTRWLFIRSLVILAVRFPILIVAIMLWGLPGVVFGRVFVGVGVVVYNMYLVRQIINLPVLTQFTDNWRCLTSMAGAAGSILLLSPAVPDGAGSMTLLTFVVLQGLGGLTLYVLMNIGLWAASGFPDGPERELKTLAQPFVRKLRKT